MSFYVTLPSTASMDFYPENTTSNFTTKLASPIRLEGKWQVALIGFSYRLNISMRIGSVTIFKKRDGSSNIWYNIGKIDFDSYEGEKYVELLSRIKNQFSQFQDPETQLNVLSLVIEDSLLLLKFNSKNYMVVFEGRISDILKLEPTKFAKLFNIFGQFSYTSDEIGDNIISKKYQPNATVSHNEFFFFYSDIITDQYVGDTKAKLLECFAIEGTRQKSVTSIMSNPNYVDLCLTDIPTININIKDSLGENIHFDHFSRVIVKLHFRPKHYE